MANKMLIDATHPEETRVVVTRGNRVEEFDYESASRKQLRGNIYLAKVARIEPSLQAAFVNYGGNRHGFLAFAEIHQDYYQIPLAVREAIMKEEALDRANSGREFSNGNHRQEAPGDDADSAADSKSVYENSNEQPDFAGGESGPTDESQSAQPTDREANEQSDHDNGHNDRALNADQQQPETRASESAIPLQSVLPQVVYEEFSAAVARARDAADEIPAHPDDIEGVPHDAKNNEPARADTADAHPEQTALSTSASEADAEDKEIWDSQAPSGEGGIVTVAETLTPAPIEVVGAEDALEELPQRAKRRWRHYKIQEVIKRNQIVLIQVVKEERGTKGAALTTYLSLAGRYTVLMPNTASGGGISRKITVPGDRKRLKEIAQELEVPEGMGLIIRTAGASRTKAEIKRDFEYLLRLWETVRDLTLKSTAPCLVYEESDLIKRSIRDLYNKEIDEIIVAGDTAFREAREFMRMLMPSHAKNVVFYKEPEPLFTRYEVERQLNQMFSPVVTLKSGGYIVLNQTEALVAIDVNSGRSTREYSIESTALNTNLEASDEIARQIRLRDLAGLIVIDYIDMEERRNNRNVERRLKEALRHDRARIQVGHISHFGLMEMSRQRLRQGVVEVSTMPCPTCQGIGHIRSAESIGLMILRSIEDHLRAQRPANLNVNVATEAALYILNHKRAYLLDIEMRYGVSVAIAADEKARGAHFAIERGAEATPPPPVQRGLEAPKAIYLEPAVEDEPDDEEETKAKAAGVEGEDPDASRRRRRRRRGGRSEGRDAAASNGAAHGGERQNMTSAPLNGSGGNVDAIGPQQPRAVAVDIPLAGNQELSEGPAREFSGVASETEGEDGLKRNRRRGRRGGRRHRGLENDGNGGDVNGVPGLGEQPIVPFDHDFPVNAANPSIMARTAEMAGQPAQGEASMAFPQPVHAPEQAGVILYSTPIIAESATAPEATMPVLPEPTETLPIAEIAAPVSESEAPSDLQEPVAEPKPKPVRTAPARKGWWQRSLS